MKIIISPAKKMRCDSDSFPINNIPYFINKTELLLYELKNLPDLQLQQLWKCSDSIAKPNIERIRNMDLYSNLTPAIIAYEGIQYQQMAPNVFDYESFEYLEKHLRILSGFYGILRPFDGVVPYRLEMQTKLSVSGFANLYDYWSDSIAKFLIQDTNLILNLASREYSRVITPHLPETVKFLTCSFGEIKNDRVIEKGTLCKMARGRMVRWIAENKISDFESIKFFTELRYKFSEKYSNENNYCFIKGED